MNPLEERVADLIRRRGSVPFREVMELALYDPEDGFYAHGGAGRRGDFLTSPEVGPLFGAVVAGALDRWWDELGEPDPFVVVDAGAGPGTLARAVLAATPACGPALRYVLVDRSPTQRARHREHLPLVEPASAFPPRRRSDDEDDETPAAPARDGPVVVSLGELPRVDAASVILANELLDNVPVHLLERTYDGWGEVYVTEDAGRWKPIVLPAAEPLAADADRHAPSAAVGARIPLQPDAAAWLRDAIESITRGRIVVVDYADTTPSMAARRWTDWLRTYRAHGRGGGPLDDLGAQDITCEVAIDQLARLRPPDVMSTQAEWLAVHGLDALVEEGRRTWSERAYLGDLEAVRGRSRAGEAAALVDPAGLGAFRVLEWIVG